MYDPNEQLYWQPGDYNKLAKVDPSKLDNNFIPGITWNIKQPETFKS